MLSLAMFVLKVLEALESHGVPYALAGGCAVQLHGVARETLDVDVVVPFEEEYFLHAERAFVSIGLRCRCPVTATEVFHCREDFYRNRHMISWSFWNPADPAQVDDVVLSHDLRNLERTVFEIEGRSVHVLTREALIGMKRSSPREQDRVDAEALEQRGCCRDT